MNFSVLIARFRFVNFFSSRPHIMYDDMRELSLGVLDHFLPGF